MQTIHSSATPKINIFFAILAFFMLISTFVSAKENKASLPDLVIIGVSNFKYEPNYRRVRFDVEIKNQGLGEAALTSGITFSTFISNDALIGNDATAGGITKTSLPLLSGESRVYKDVAATYSVPPTISFQFLVVHLNPSNLIVESDFTNNKGIFEVVPTNIPQYPDLIIESIENINYDYEGTSIKFDLTIKNIGSIASKNGDILIRIHESIDGITSNLHYQGYLKSVNVLNPNETQKIQGSAIFTEKKYIIVELLNTEITGEINNSNNKKSFLALTPQYADLTLQNPRYVETAYGTEIQVDVLNVGKVKTPNLFMYQTYLSTDGIKLEKPQGGSVVVTPPNATNLVLKPNESKTIRVGNKSHLTEPMTTFPYFIIVIDHDNKNRESNENNNTIVFKR
jgi:hypothetical protein